jgi:hypothetical protein
MNKENVLKWCRLLNGGRAGVHNEARSGLPSAITEDLKDNVGDHVRENRQFTVDELHEVFPCVSRSVLCETVTVRLQYRKIFAMWVPRIFTDKHKQKQLRTG